MNKRELAAKAFKNEKTERVPVGFWFHYAKDEIEDGFKNTALFDNNVEGHKKFYREFQPDFVKIMSDGFFIYPGEAFKNAKTGPELGKAVSIGENHRWIEKQVEYAKTITAHCGAEVMCFYNIFSPATFFRFCRADQGDKGLADFIAQDRDAAAHALDVAAGDIALLIRRLLSETGVDGIYFSVQDINDPRVTDEIREKILAPSDLKALEPAVKVSQFNILHICGYAGCKNDLSHFTGYPAQIINFASVVEGVSLGEGKKIFGGKPVIGGFGNTTDDLLYTGSRAEIETETERLLKEAGTLGVVLGADCTVPRDISIDHLTWVRDKAAAFCAS
ncbi:MAG: uroporphyrinogen decarboxylase [Treponema sp.]|jgi:uroporphyrinogen decarboxylase|nr:uroporphyrinogen decarboxylase [Treponema sp.]